MKFPYYSSLKKILLKPTPIFGLKLWILIASSTVLFIIIIISFILCCFRRRKSYQLSYPKAKDRRNNAYNNSSSLVSQKRKLLISDQLSSRVSYTTQNSSVTVNDLGLVAKYSPVVKDAVWLGDKLSMKDIEMATNGLSKENMIGNGGDYGNVYRAILMDNRRVAIKRLVINSCKVEDFIEEAEAIGHIRHKNLVKLFGYCIEGSYRVLISEYVDNNNLHYWLHDCPKEFSPLTWSIRVKIIQGIAKGLAYLHEDVEPKILHRSLKSSNILLDHQWNPKVSDFGIAKLFGSQWVMIIMDTLGYLAPEQACTGICTEKTDVYCFGVLIMEIVTGRSPLDRAQPQPYLVEWVKSMAANGKAAYVVDPRLPEMPYLKELKQILLIAVRCIDPDVASRPRMGEVIHMLEPRDLLLDDHEYRNKRETSCDSFSPKPSNQNAAEFKENIPASPNGDNSSNINSRYEKMRLK